MRSELATDYLAFCKRYGADPGDPLIAARWVDDLRRRGRVSADDTRVKLNELGLRYHIAGASCPSSTASGATFILSELSVPKCSHHFTPTTFASTAYH